MGHPKHQDMLGLEQFLVSSSSSYGTRGLPFLQLERPLA